MAVYPQVDPEVISSYIMEGESNVKPCILVLKKNGIVFGLIIGLIKDMELAIRIGYFNMFRPKAKVLSILDRGIVGVEAPEDTEVVCDALKKLLEDGIADYIHMASIDKNSLIRSQVRRIFGNLCLEGEFDSRWLLELPSRYDEFLESLSKGIRRDVKWRQKKLNKTFNNMAIKSILPGEEYFDSNIKKDILQVFQNTYQYRLGLSAENFPQVLNKLLEKKRIAAVVLYIDDKPVAFGISHAFKKAWYFVQTGYDPSFKKWYIGEAIWLEMIKKAIEYGAKVLDYGLGHSEKKRQFGAICHEEGHIRVFGSSARGKKLKAMIFFSIRVNRISSKFLDKIGLKSNLKRLLRKVL